jgi:DNA helicase HerA-like ATPase
VTAWEDLPEWTGPLESTDQILVVAATGGAKSTLLATITLDVSSLVVIDDKGAMALPRSRLVQLPPWADGERDPLRADTFNRAVRDGLAWRDHTKAFNRVIVRFDPADVENVAAHDVVFWSIFSRGDTVCWVDEISATGATAQRAPAGLRAISARGRTRGVGLITASQRPFGLTPGIVRYNATYLIIGPVDPDDIKDLHREGVEIATTLPRKRGRFLLYVAGEQSPYRLFVPIPPALRGWKAP